MVVEIYSKQHNSQTIRARELTVGENVHPQTCVTCDVSQVTCYVSSVTCHMSRDNFILFYFFHLFFFQRNGGASHWRVCNQQGLDPVQF